MGVSFKCELIYDQPPCFDNQKIKILNYALYFSFLNLPRKVVLSGLTTYLVA